ncbi:MAG: hypothetical protein HY270_03015 [Deltaproteobacteria bacterium]|nr:hypothetical protein [Deltaproteobacteria bacterium]
MLPRALKANFATAVRRLLRPIVRQVIHYGLSYPAFDRLVREAFVEAAERDFALPFKRQTDSRVSLVTGLNRKEVAQLRRQVASDKVVEVEDTLLTHLIGRWMAGPPYATPDGVARRLPYEATNARAASFARLTRDVVGVDIPVRSVLDELLRTGAAALLPNGDVELRREVHVPATDVEGKLALLGSDPAEVFRTIIHNIEQPDTPWLQRKIVYDNIGSDALPQLKEEARRIGTEYMRRANALLASYDRDRHPGAAGGKRSRVVLGTYYFEEDTPSDVLPPAEEEKPRPPGRIRRTK